MLAWHSGDDALSKQHGVLFVAKVRKSCARSAEEQLIRNTPLCSVTFAARTAARLSNRSGVRFFTKLNMLAWLSR